MLTKMIFKILLKATVPIICAVAMLSYSLYGNPAKIFQKAAGGALQSAKSSVRDAGDTLQSVAPKTLSSSKTTIYKWVDENGNTQFGSAAPEGVNATAKTYNNNANLMAATPVEEKKPQKKEQIPGMGLDGQRMPGMAGANLPVAVDPAVLSEFLQTMQQREP